MKVKYIETFGFKAPLPNSNSPKVLNTSLLSNCSYCRNSIIRNYLQNTCKDTVYLISLKLNKVNIFRME